MEAFNKIFINSGFPEIYNNITNIDDIKRMYLKDNDLNASI